MTSNLGFDHQSELHSVGFIENNTESGKKRAISALKKHYSSEFINRIDEIIYFEPTSKEALTRIALSALTDFYNKVEQTGHFIKSDPAIPEYLAEISNSAPGGVRDLLKNISNLIEIPTINIIISSDQAGKKPISVSLTNDGIKVCEESEALLG
jgi:ATP-dependent Clp protease ATP-binding subunit ClpC